MTRKPTKKRAGFDSFYSRVRTIIEDARSSIVRTVDSAIVQAYWLVGREIVEEELGGKERAGYGEQLVRRLSERLQQDLGKGFNLSNVKAMRQLYLTYPSLLPAEIGHAARGQFQLASNSGKSRAVRGQSSETPAVAIVHAVHGQSGPALVPAIRRAVRSELKSLPECSLNPNLSWTHYRVLCRVESPYARAFYEMETAKNRWASRELERQINSLLFERQAKSRDKEGLMRLALKGQEIQTPADAIKDPVVLEFLGLPESHRLVESELQEALLNNLQAFLLELGKGFAFVARQRRLTLEGDHFYVDLVFYHTVLKCHVLIDLKTGKLTHADLGQMQLYVNYFDAECLTVGDNPTVGLILCTDKNDTVVKYMLSKGNQRIFASRYKLYLPDAKELAEEIARTRRRFVGSHPVALPDKGNR